MDQRLIYNFSEIDLTQVELAGGKGSSLGELTRAGIPVPPGFIVSSAAFEMFVQTSDNQHYIDEMMQKLESGSIELSRAALEITAFLDGLEVPVAILRAIEQAVIELGVQRVSVRSSATCEDSSTSAWAGQLETYLYVSPEDVVKRVRDCWMSMFSQSALVYGDVHGFGGRQIAMAVVVQQMVLSEVSGIGFSVHPVTQEPDMLLIEACLGLGEAIVSGRIIPDQYIVERGSLQIVESIVGDQHEGLFVEAPASECATWRKLDGQGSKRKLSDAQVVEYAELMSRIQDHYGHPVDTEWAIEDGQFQVLQARPITTLADEYRDSLLPGYDWQLLVRRPQSLIEVSISSHWVDSRHAEKSLGVHVDRQLAIQDEAGLANLLLDSADVEACLQRVVDLLEKDRSQLIEILEYGLAIYQKTEDRIKQGFKGFSNLDEAVDFFADVAQHTTVFPFWVLTVFGQQNIEDPEVKILAEQLRSRTLYPAIERQIIDPMVSRITETMGFSAPDQAPNVVTWSELRQQIIDCDTLEARLQAVREGKRFIFQTIDGNDRVDFVSQTGYLLMRLAKQRQIVPQMDNSLLSGQSAWPGIYQGRARVVLSPDVVDQTFEEGEVLVSIQSSPALMPFLKRCGAIVTDDGGIACHAAIIARELRKPTLIGTRSATSAIHTGDLVEVDTYAQTVRILERSN